MRGFTRANFPHGIHDEYFLGAKENGERGHLARLAAHILTTASLRARSFAGRWCSLLAQAARNDLSYKDWYILSAWCHSRSYLWKFCAKTLNARFPKPAPLFLRSSFRAPQSLLVSMRRKRIAPFRYQSHVFMTHRDDFLPFYVMMKDVFWYEQNSILSKVALVKIAPPFQLVEKNY